MKLDIDQNCLLIALKIPVIVFFTGLLCLKEVFLCQAKPMRMKKILLLASLIIPMTSVFAQEILTISPVPIEQSFFVDLSNSYLDLEMHTTLTNNSEDTIQLRWVREITEKPEAWQTQICDNNLCYDPIVSTNYDPNLGINMPVYMNPGESFNLIFHVLPKGFAGYGEFKIPFYYFAEGDTAVLAEAIFRATVESVTSVGSEAKEKLKVFPNPATDYIELTNNYIVDRMVIYNLLGREVRNFEVINGSLYEVADLPNGMYLVALINEEEGILKTFRLNKRSIRP